MKRNLSTPLVVVALLFALTISACSSLSKNEETPPQEPQVIIVTATPQPPIQPLATEPPVVLTEAPAVVATEPPAEDNTGAQEGMYFKDEFDNGLENYTHFIFNGNEFRIYENNKELEKKAGVELKDGKVNFNMQEYQLAYYFVYEPQTYEDVTVSAEVENLGYNSSVTLLFCRYDEEMGWYQLISDFQGLWSLYYFDALIEKDFNYLTDGGAAEFNYGKGKNKFTLVCKGNEISVYVNDVLAQTVEDENLKTGKVGFGAQTNNTYTILNIPWFEVSQP